MAVVLSREPIFICPLCNYSWCRHCKCDWHSFKTCDQYQREKISAKHQVSARLATPDCSLESDPYTTHMYISRQSQAGGRYPLTLVLRTAVSALLMGVLSCLLAISSLRLVLELAAAAGVGPGRGLIKEDT